MHCDDTTSHSVASGLPMQRLTGYVCHGDAGSTPGNHAIEGHLQGEGM